MKILAVIMIILQLSLMCQMSEVMNEIRKHNNEKETW